MASMYNLLKEINQIKIDKIDWMFKLRLARAYSLPSFDDPKKVFSKEYVFHDAEGTRMHATIRHPYIEKFSPMLEENGLYHRQNVIVTENTSQYKTVDEKYKLKFIAKTRITKVFDDNFPLNVYNFKPFEAFEDVQSFDDKILTDVIGELVSRSSPQFRESFRDLSKMMDIVLKSIRGTTLSCTLWGDFVDNLTSYLETSNDSPVIILIQMGKVKEFMGELRISSTYHVTKVIINEDIRDIIDFKNSLISECSSSTPVNSISLTPSRQHVNDFESCQDLFRTIEEILEIKEVGDYVTYGKIVDVHSVIDWWYLACKKCIKKMTPSCGRFLCEKCGQYHVSGNIRYKLQVYVSDDTGSAEFLLWDKPCAQLLGKSAIELKKEWDGKNLPEKIQNIIGMQVLSKIQFRETQYGRRKGVFSVPSLTTEKFIIDKYCNVNDGGEESDIFQKTKDSKDAETITASVMVNSSDDEAITPLNKDTKTVGMESIESIGNIQENSLKRKIREEYPRSKKDSKLGEIIKQEKK